MAARYAKLVVQKDILKISFVKKDEIEHNLHFECERYRTYNVPFTMREIQSAVRNIGNTAAGQDDISYSIISQLPDVAMPTLLALYNVVWTQGEYPKLWKEASIIPLPKAGKDPLKAKNYPPVSLMCCLGKLLELSLIHI